MVKLKSSLIIASLLVCFSQEAVSQNKKKKKNQLNQQLQLQKLQNLMLKKAQSLTIR